MNFNEAVKKAMESMNLKPSDVARESKYSSQHIRDLLAGERRWNEESIRRVCEALGITVTYEIDSEEQPIVSESAETP